jgi:hypothetical protein
LWTSASLLPFGVASRATNAYCNVNFDCEQRELQLHHQLQHQLQLQRHHHRHHQVGSNCYIVCTCAVITVV